MHLALNLVVIVKQLLKNKQKMTNMHQCATTVVTKHNVLAVAMYVRLAVLQLAVVKELRHKK
jgi:hypothetical protein